MPIGTFRKLYRKAYRTFEDYCRGRWQFSGNYARRLADAFEVYSNIQNVPMGTFKELPQTERVVRPLIILESDDQRAA